jgi:hypothetical protein
MKVAKLRSEIAVVLLLGAGLLSCPGRAFSQSRKTATASLYIQVNVVPVLHSEPPREPDHSSAGIAFELNNQPTQFDRQSSTREVSGQSNSHEQPIMVETVTLTPK